MNSSKKIFSFTKNKKKTYSKFDWINSKILIKFDVFSLIEVSFAKIYFIKDFIA